jgi:hypothetical protein
MASRRWIRHERGKIRGATEHCGASGQAGRERQRKGSALQICSSRGAETRTAIGKRPGGGARPAFISELTSTAST